MPGGASMMKREHGFQDEIRRRFPGINMVALQFGMADRAKSMAMTENVLPHYVSLGTPHRNTRCDVQRLAVGRTATPGIGRRFHRAT
jgi:hypothetical protein